MVKAQTRCLDQHCSPNPCQAYYQASLQNRPTLIYPASNLLQTPNFRTYNRNQYIAGKAQTEEKDNRYILIWKVRQRSLVFPALRFYYLLWYHQKAYWKLYKPSVSKSQGWCSERGGDGGVRDAPSEADELSRAARTPAPYQARVHTTQSEFLRLGLLPSFYSPILWKWCFSICKGY